MRAEGPAVINCRTPPLTPSHGGVLGSSGPGAGSQEPVVSDELTSPTRGSKGEPALSMSQRKERLVLHICREAESCGTLARPDEHIVPSHGGNVWAA